MSSCHSKSKGRLTPEEIEERSRDFQQKRYDYIKKDFRNIVVQGALHYMANQGFLPDLALNVDKKGAIVEALEDALIILKENGNANKIREAIARRSEARTTGVPDREVPKV